MRREDVDLDRQRNARHREVEACRAVAGKIDPVLALEAAQPGGRQCFAHHGLMVRFGRAAGHTVAERLEVPPNEWPAGREPIDCDTPHLVLAMSSVVHHLLDDRQQVAGSNRPGQVERRSWSIGEDDAISAYDAIRVMQRLRPVWNDPRRIRGLSSRRRDDMDPVVAWKPSQPPEPTGGRSADHHLGVCGTHCSAASIEVERRHRHPIDPTQHRLEVAVRDQATDVVRRQPQFLQGPSRGHTVVRLEVDQRFGGEQSHGDSCLRS